MKTPNDKDGAAMTIGDVWALHHDGKLIARLTVTGADFPWLQATVEELPGFDAVRTWFAEQESAAAEEDFERMDRAYAQIRSALAMTFPDGTPVPEFMLDIYQDGTAGWRWHNEPFDTNNA
jgi:hypothetical protein